MKNKSAYLFVSILFFSFSLFGQIFAKDFLDNQRKTSFEDKVIEFVNDTRSEDIIITVQDHTPILDLVIEGTINSGKLNVVLVDPNGNSYGNFTIEEEESDQKEVSTSEMIKSFKEPILGDWKVKISTVNASGKIKIGAFFEKDYHIKVPSEFTPNEDGINDILKLESLNIAKIISFDIYNRWGELVFSSKKMDDAWDGKVNNKLQESGTYYYLIKAKTNSGQEITQSGYTVLRN